MPEPRILYVTGWLRSGSTVLGNILGELPGVVHVGELHYLWRNGILGAGSNSSCGCGEGLTGCPFWAPILEASGATDRVAARQMVSWQDALLRTRHTQARLAELRDGTPTAAGAEEATDRTVEIYRLLAKYGGDRLIVDSSKFPAEAAVLLGRRDLDVRVLHIVRDPRATAYSYKRAKAYIDPMHPALSSGYWTAFNLASELVGRAGPDRYLRIRHEDICRRPREAVASVMGFAGIDGESPVDEAGEVFLGQNHTVTGNPDRLSAGKTAIRADERWRTGLSRGEIAAATAPALPMLLRYGYPFAPAR